MALAPACYIMLPSVKNTDTTSSVFRETLNSDGGTMAGEVSRKPRWPEYFCAVEMTYSPELIAKTV